MVDTLRYLKFSLEAEEMLKTLKRETKVLHLGFRRNIREWCGEAGIDGRETRAGGPEGGSCSGASDKSPGLQDSEGGPRESRG